MFFFSWEGVGRMHARSRTALLCSAAVRCCRLRLGWTRWKRSDSTKKGLASFKTGAAQCRAPRILFA